MNFLLDTILLYYIKEIFFRTLYIFISIILFFILYLNYIEEIYEFFIDIILNLNYIQFKGFISTNIQELFNYNLYIAILLSCFINIPFLYLQIWLFLISCFNKYEQWHITRLILYSLFLYVFSILIFTFFAFPMIWNFYFYDTTIFIIQPNITSFLSLFLNTLYIFILLFQTPLMFYFILYCNLLYVNTYYSIKYMLWLDFFIITVLIFYFNIVNLIIINIILMLLYDFSIYLYISNKYYKKLLNV